ncbi:hypothetical protein EUGRSUZ_L00341 [Eucalyptus grandis]|uniref:Uncharacterized protein n=1 Tax=Eucalyptus grandis TaxID=71139 RepID=A0A058ZVI3_EUCGR|nr:hypothetical protein EUGRSUZ_L00341 [Eucalyptus grandis]
MAAQQTLDPDLSRLWLHRRGRPSPDLGEGWPRQDLFHHFLRLSHDGSTEIWRRSCSAMDRSRSGEGLALSFSEAQ